MSSTPSIESFSLVSDFYCRCMYLSFLFPLSYRHHFCFISIHFPIVFLRFLITNFQVIQKVFLTNSDCCDIVSKYTFRCYSFLQIFKTNTSFLHTCATFFHYFVHENVKQHGAQDTALPLSSCHAKSLGLHGFMYNIIDITSIDTLYVF